MGFASECLAFANVPEPESLRRAGLTDPNDPRWPAGVPRDRGADWDFETVRDHYVATLYGADPARLRRDDPERYLALGRAAVAECMEATFAEWRRAQSARWAGSSSPGAISPRRRLGCDRAGRPAEIGVVRLKRAFRPVQVMLSDEGLNGLHVHALNETPLPVEAVLRLAFLDAAGKAVVKAERALTLAPRGAITLTSAEMLGRFFDATCAYRFGRRSTASPTPSCSTPRAIQSRMPSTFPRAGTWRPIRRASRPNSPKVPRAGA